jgi:putative component of membrane protein insertase Oxa1/YidC/SpoIIIJ protein YidD
VRFATALALAAIRCYQTVVSPYKGFSCALRVATGGASCSEYGYAVIARFGLSRGLGLLQRRFELCGHVHRRAHACPPPHPRLKYQRGFCDAPCDLPCDGHGHCVSADTAADAASCVCDLTDWGRPSRNGRRHRERARRSEELDAAAERVRRREARIREGRDR